MLGTCYALTALSAALLLSGAAYIAETIVTPKSAIIDKDGMQRAVDFQEAIDTNIRYNLSDDLAPIVAAIRYAENGSAGKEYGILHPRVKPTYRSQAGWCAATVQKHFDRWELAGSRGLFIDSLAARYAPVGADNDPNGLNRNWAKNVKHYIPKCGGKVF